MIRGILFDMDGVLVDSEQFYAGRRRRFLQGKGIAMSAHVDFTGSNEKTIWETLVPDNERLQEKLKMEYRAYQKQYPLPYKELMDPQVHPLFVALKQRNLLLAIASSSSRECIGDLIREAHIENLVDYYISGEDCKAPKPDPAIYLHTLEAIHLSAQEAYVVEDSPFGIEAARRANIRVFALLPRDGTVLDQSQANEKLRSLTDLLNFLPRQISKN